MIVFWCIYWKLESQIEHNLPKYQCLTFPLKSHDVWNDWQEEYRQEIGTERLMHDTKEKILQHRWRNPSLSIHGKV